MCLSLPGVCGATGLLWYGVDTYARYKQEVCVIRQQDYISYE